MAEEPDIRKTTSADDAELERLYGNAFPDEDLVPLVTQLIAEPGEVLSLVAETDAAAAGHVAVTLCRVGDGTPVALLGPLAVAPAHQRQGLGRRLIDAAIAGSRDWSVAQINVLGDPGYYGRFGFQADERVLPPFPLPPEWRGAWQMRPLDCRIQAAGTLAVPGFWNDPALWLP